MNIFFKKVNVTLTMHYFSIRSSFFKRLYMAIDLVDFTHSLTANFNSLKMCNLINKPDIKILLVKLTFEENRVFSLLKNF